MANAQTQQRKVVTPVFRVSFNKIFRPDQNERGQNVYSITAIFDSDADLKAMEQLVKETREAKYQKKVIPNFREPFRKGVDSEYDLSKYPEYKGKIICTFKSYGRVVRVIGPDKQEILDEEDFYSGCYARAAITAFTYDQQGNKGVSFGLASLMKVKDGERLAGSVSNPEDDFKEFPVEGFGEENSGQFGSEDL